MSAVREEAGEERSWSASVVQWVSRLVPRGQWLPDRHCGLLRISSSLRKVSGSTLSSSREGILLAS